MKLFSLFFAVLCSITQLQSAERIPSDYKEKIEAFLVAKNPQYGKFYCDYSAPKRVLIGDAKEERYAVRCDWGASLKSGATLLMIATSTFIFDDDKISEPGRDVKIEWIDGQPALERKKPNQSSTAQRP